MAFRFPLPRRGLSRASARSLPALDRGGPERLPAGQRLEPGPRPDLTLAWHDTAFTDVQLVSTFARQGPAPSNGSYMHCHKIILASRCPSRRDVREHLKRVAQRREVAERWQELQAHIHNGHLLHFHFVFACVKLCRLGGRMGGWDTVWAVAEVLCGPLPQRPVAAGPDLCRVPCAILGRALDLRAARRPPIFRLYSGVGSCE